MIQLWSDEVEQSVRSHAVSLDQQVTPSSIVFCKRCVVSNQRPRITLDEDGVCSACRFAEKKNNIDWPAREKELRAMLNAHRRPSGHDVIVPASGGKDSSTVAHKLKHEYGMNPLCVKWAPFIYTDIGRKNLDAFIASGFDVLVAHPGGQIHRKLARLSFEYLGDPFQPFVFGQLCYPMHIADKFGIPLVFYGENGEAEYGGDQSANDKPCWDFSDWERVYLKGAGVKKLIDIGVGLGVLSDLEVRQISQFYSLPYFDASRPEFHWLGYYTKWHPQSNFYRAAEHTGFKPNPKGRSEGTYSKYASLDDKLDGLHYWMAYVKFGIGRCTSDAAHEVRDGDLSRDEAVALVKRYDGEFPSLYHKEVLEYLGLDEEQFWRVVDRFRNPVIWYEKNLRRGAWDALQESDSAA